MGRLVVVLSTRGQVCNGLLRFAVFIGSTPSDAHMLYESTYSRYKAVY